MCQYDRRLYNLVLRLTRDADEAADVTQEAFVRAWRAWDGFEGRSAPYSWLCQIAINVCRNRMRDRCRRAETGEDLAGAEMAADGPSPEESVECMELRDRVRRAVETLPWDYRLVVLLRDCQELSYQETAQAAGLSVDVVRTRLARARGMLRRKLEGYI